MRAPLWSSALTAVAMFLATPASAAPFDPEPWVADLEQARQAIHEKYANLEWLESEREVKVDTLFADLAQRMLRAPDEAAARAVFERLSRKMRDGHFAIEWPRPQAVAMVPAAAKLAAPDLCAEIGYDARSNKPGTAQALPGYQPLEGGGDNPFAAGTLMSGGTRVGVLRIGIFMPQGYPDMCRAAARALKIPGDKPCDDQCKDQILTWAYRGLTGALEQRARQLKAAGATVLLIDITGNGGGSEWSQAAARIFTPRQIVSQRRAFVRGAHWAGQWRDLAAHLRSFAEAAPPEDRNRLLAWAAEADAAMREAEKPCPSSGPCSRLVTADYATGLVSSIPAGAFAGKDWGVHVFNPAQFPYHDGIWSGPLIVLVDQETWSAAEEFAAVLQDNGAALIMGARTGGAGCGYTYGGTPTTLKNSSAVLMLPDCVRYRADGSNEVRGVLPDETVPLRADDGVKLRARLVAERLPAVVARVSGTTAAAAR